MHAGRSDLTAYNSSLNQRQSIFTADDRSPFHTVQVVVLDAADGTLLAQHCLDSGALRELAADGTPVLQVSMQEVPVLRIKHTRSTLYFSSTE